MENFLDEIPDEELRGERVTLRLLHEGDAPALFSLIDGSREFLARHLPWPAECTCVEDVESRIESWEIQAQMANGACWGIFAKDAGSSQSAGSLRPADGSVPANSQQHASDLQLAGVIILGWIQAAHLSASVSYWLGECFTGRGLATDALKILSHFAFNRLGLNRLEISASVTNKASQTVATRAGYTQEGFSREFERINGKFEDHVRFSRLARDPQ
ncbi:ribosomal-protein-serine acetyltransferase [Fibrobacter sp. UWCM]|uniref:GNAT family N-acetyltransferase n=1 Tax=Fibrobacter sp. UWCM TaxID=1896208 RepID=UPI0009152787|nr:GNAT family protein [Fibrobacter sp. UWCM]SHG31845.1 ribosomal-protein-serine acetyltransferase [Fibrobacter sp. UWCM]